MYGRNRCNVGVNSETCNHSHVAYHGNYFVDNNYDSNSQYDTDFRSSAACHETGHTVGLTHGDDAHPVTYSGDTSLLIGCMEKKIADYGTLDKLLKAHNVDHIDGYY